MLFFGESYLKIKLVMFIFALCNKLFIRSALGPESSNSAVTKDENRNHSGSEDTERDQPSSGIWEEERQCADVIKQKIPVINAADVSVFQLWMNLKFGEDSLY